MGADDFHVIPSAARNLCLPPTKDVRFFAALGMTARKAGTDNSQLGVGDFSLPLAFLLRTLLSIFFTAENAEIDLETPGSYSAFYASSAVKV
jgi:hypothetical protein